VKLLALLGAIFALSGFMLLVSVFVGFFGGFNTFAFMSAEVCNFFYNIACIFYISRRRRRPEKPTVFGIFFVHFLSGDASGKGSCLRPTQFR
jgi:hypothetical protein